jgi:hypothetical protein
MFTFHVFITNVHHILQSNCPSPFAQCVLISLLLFACCTVIAGGNSFIKHNKIHCTSQTTRVPQREGRINVNYVYISISTYVYTFSLKK